MLECIILDQIGSDWISLDQIGSDWIRLDDLGISQSALDTLAACSFIIQISIKWIIITCITAKEILIMVWKFEGIVTIFGAIVRIFELIIQ